MTEGLGLLFVGLALGVLFGALAATLWLKRRPDQTAALQAQLDAERRIAAERQEAQDRAQAAMAAHFQALADKSLKENNEAFFRLARERFAALQEGAKTDLDARQQSINQLVLPLKEKLISMDQHIRALEEKREGAYQALHSQIEGMAQQHQQLRAETGNLVRALRAPKARGSWGEMQLRRVVELAGMIEHVDFATEHSIETDDGRRRPDVLVHLPGGKLIVIDAKAPLDAYLDAVNAELPIEEREAATVRHAEHVRRHLKLLGSKSYAGQFDTSPDFTVLFLPDEGAFSAALQADATLIEAGIADQVIIATPTTLIALLKAVAYGWRQEALAEEAQEIGRHGRVLYERLGGFLGYLDGVGKALGKATETYNKAIGSLEARLLPAARQFERFQPTAGAVETPSQIEGQPREIAAPERSEKSEDRQPDSDAAE